MNHQSNASQQNEHGTSKSFRDPRPFPRAIPFTPLTWPTARNLQTQVQQIKTSSKSTVQSGLGTVSQPRASARTTPQNVSHVKVTSKPNGDQKQVTVQFAHNTNDPYFNGASIYLRRAGTPPVKVASGAKSPITFSVPKSNASHSIFVVSDGNWGSTDVLTSPAHRLKLS